VQQPVATTTTSTSGGGDSASEAGGSRGGGGGGGGSVSDSGGQPKVRSPVATKLFAAVNGNGSGGGGGGSAAGTDDECEMKTSLEEEAATPERRKEGESDPGKGSVVTTKAEGKAANGVDRNRIKEADPGG